MRELKDDSMLNLMNEIKAQGLTTFTVKTIGDKVVKFVYDDTGLSASKKTQIDNFIKTKNPDLR